MLAKHSAAIMLTSGRHLKPHVDTFNQIKQQQLSPRMGNGTVEVAPRSRWDVSVVVRFLSKFVRSLMKFNLTFADFPTHSEKPPKQNPRQTFPPSGQKAGRDLGRGIRRATFEKSCPG